MTGTTELPYEIWLQILRFLPPEIIRQFRCVNSLFYNISLSEYHRITHWIGYYHRCCCNAPLWDPENARRVRVLKIRKGPVYPSKYEPPRRTRPGSRWTIWRSIKEKISQICG
ncbi:hypothetical protein M413DRAFT_445537, partial [Hebeloma cylindrosporum]